MINNKEAVRFRHHFLINGGILSVCTSLNHESGLVTVGWSIFNPDDLKWVRKMGNDIARKRMKNSPLTFTLSADEPVICDYVSLRALMLILGSAKRIGGDIIPVNTTKSIPRSTLVAIEYEMIRILSLLGERIGLPSITEQHAKMINQIVQWVLTNWMTGWFGFLLYWIPMAVCVVGYTIRTFENYQKDIEARAKYIRYLALKSKKEVDNRITQVFYSPTDKIGTLLGRALVSIVPFANAWAAIFDISPKLFCRLISMIEKIFDQPLVPRPKDIQ